jgi:hypothetical protein
MLSIGCWHEWTLQMGSKQKTVQKISGTWQNTSEPRNLAENLSSHTTSKAQKLELRSPEIKEDPDIQAITERVSATFGFENSKLWLERPTTALQGEAPATLIQSEAGRERIRKLLDQIDHGFAA